MCVVQVQPEEPRVSRARQHARDQNSHTSTSQQHYFLHRCPKGLTRWASLESTHQFLLCQTGSWSPKSLPLTEPGRSPDHDCWSHGRIHVSTPPECCFSRTLRYLGESSSDRGSLTCTVERLSSLRPHTQLREPNSKSTWTILEGPEVASDRGETNAR